MNVGESEASTVVAGLRDSYIVNELKGMKVELACSLVTANVGAVESKGIILVGEKSEQGAERRRRGMLVLQGGNVVVNVER